MMLRRATKTTLFSFPKDHGQHPAFRTEWWYVAGWLSDEDGVEFAYHFTIFRRALERWSDLPLVGIALKSKRLRESTHVKRALAHMLESQNSRRIPVDGYVGHLSLTNLQAKRYHFFERGGISILGVAGAHDARLDVWVKDWRLYEKEGLVHLRAERHGCGLALTMRAQKDVLLHGEAGLSAKGEGPGYASYHYSLPSLVTSGALTWEGKSHVVKGRSLMDREFGTAMLPRTVQGWDWFGLMLDNDCQVLVSVIRDATGNMSRCSGGTVSFPDGRCRRFFWNDIWLQERGSWTSPCTGAVYTTAWMVGIRTLDIELSVTAVIPEHELRSSTSATVDYWEGPVTAMGTMGSRLVSGFGHVELVGYAQSVGGKF